MRDLLFVYGTLMRGFDHPMARLLEQNADFLGEAHCAGRLYLVRHYPGLVDSDDPADRVFGQLFRLRQPRDVLAKLDDYEGCGEAAAPPHEFIRATRPVTASRRHGAPGLRLSLQLAARRPAADRGRAVRSGVSANSCA